ARNAAADVATERGVVLEEMSMRDDDPEDTLHEVFQHALFGDHRLGRSVLGTERSITDMTRARVHGFYRRNYQLPRMVLAVTGNVDHADVVRQVRQLLGERLTGAATPEPPRVGRGRLPRPQPLALRAADTEQAHVLLRSEEHTSELQSRFDLVCRLLLEKKKIRP